MPPGMLTKHLIMLALYCFLILYIVKHKEPSYTVLGVLSLIIIVIHFFFPGVAIAHDYRQLITQFPLCAEHAHGVYTVDWLPNTWVGATRDNKHILVSSNVESGSLRYVLAHECGHIVHANVNAENVFGVGRFVSWYAAVSPEEDFAETYALFVLDQPGFYKKSRKYPSLRRKYTYFLKLFRSYQP